MHLYVFISLYPALSAISSCNLEISANPSEVNSEILRLRRLYNIIVQLVADLVFSYSVQIFCQHDIVGHNSTIMIVHSTSNKTDPKVKKNQAPICTSGKSGSEPLEILIFIGTIGQPNPSPNFWKNRLLH